MKILKFGGTSMGSVEALKNVTEIIEKNFHAKEEQVIVCSAMNGITDRLIEIGHLAEYGREAEAIEIFKEIKRRHFETAEHFRVAETFNFSIDPIFEDLKNFIHGCTMIREVSARSAAYLTAFGEKFSTRLLAEILKTRAVPAFQMDSEFVRTTGKNFLEDEIDWPTTKDEVLAAIDPVIKREQVPIVTGFFGTNKNGILSLLGRGGSDFTGAILGVSLGAKIVEIWTDVDGFLSADPRIVKNAKILDEIGFAEAAELCAFGAKVLHPKTIRPVIDGGGAVFIRNTFAPEKPGTKISAHGKISEMPVLSISRKKGGLVSLDLFGTSISMKKSDIFYELFSAVREFDVVIDAIAASELMISFCAEEKFLTDEFCEKVRKIAPIEVRKNRDILAIVSPENIQGCSGILGKIFGALSNAGISVEMDSENATEIAQLVVVKSENSETAIRAIHKNLIEN